MKSLTLVLAVASLLIFFITTPAKAGVEILNPYSGVSWKSGDNEKITWKENNNAPLLTSLKSLTFTLMAGTQDSQFPVSVIATGIDGSSLSLAYTVPSSLGPSGSFYFIKVSQSSSSYLAYSGYFTITGVSGTIPNFDPNNPGTPLSSSAASSSPSSTLSSSDNSTTTASASNSAATNSAASTKTKLSTSSTGLGVPTATSVTTTSSTNGPTSTQSPTSKSSDSNQLATNFYVLSLTLFIIAFYLY